MKIKLNDSVNIDLEELIVSRMLIQANSGGGKSWAIRRIIEQAFGKVQIIVIDPEGEFSNLRQKYDFVYIAKDGDAPATPQSAGLLAQRLMETKASAIIDLYEIPMERKQFVKNFLDSLVNLPKSLWHDCLVIIDEAHKFAPEKEESVALESVSNLASLGRKRGYCLIAASGRPAKLSKDVAAECNNKLVGRAVQDVDRKRNADEIGLTSKEEVLALRNLDPGKFYVFGPAISRDVQIIQVGDVAIKPPKRGAAKHRPPAASPVIKKILAQLKDLPQEAQKEAQTIQELHRDLIAAKREIVRLGRHQPVAKELSPMGVSQWANYGKKYAYWQFFEKQAIEREQKAFHAFKEKIKMELFKTHGNIGKLLELVGHAEGRGKPLPVSHAHATEEHRAIKRTPITAGTQESLPPLDAGIEEAGHVSDKQWDALEKPLSKGARAILSYLHSVYPHWKSKAQLWVATGYSPGGGFNNLVYELTGPKLIETSAGKYAAIEPVDRSLIEDSFDVSLDKWFSKLSKGAGMILRILLEDPDTLWTKEELASRTGYALGGGFNNLVYELTGKEIAIKEGADYKMNPEMMEL